MHNPNNTQPQIIIPVDGKNYRLNTDELVYFMQEINKFTSPSEFEAIFESLTGYVEDGVPAGHPLSEYQRVMKLLRKTSILLQDFIEEVN